MIYYILWTLDPHPQFKKGEEDRKFLIYDILYRPPPPNYKRQLYFVKYASDAFKVSFCPQFNYITIRMKKGAKQIPNIASEGIKSQESVFVEGRFVLYYYFLIYQRQRHTKS